jgi:xylan 1,4-beta-xylosidase
MWNLRRTYACSIVLSVAIAISFSSPLSAQTPASETISVDGTARGTPLPHFWEHMFGSGRAILSLRESYRQDLRDVKKITGMQYIRFHAIRFSTFHT